MLDTMGFKEAVQSWDLPQPGSNRGYRPKQLIEQIIVSLWCAAARFAHADITRLDATLVRLLDWGYCRRQPWRLWDWEPGAAIGLMHGYPVPERSGTFFATLPMATYSSERHTI
jgi:hypothetical protein